MASSFTSPAGLAIGAKVTVAVPFKRPLLEIRIDRQLDMLHIDRRGPARICVPLARRSAPPDRPGPSLRRSASFQPRAMRLPTRSRRIERFQLNFMPPTFSLARGELQGFNSSKSSRSNWPEMFDIMKALSQFLVLVTALALIGCGGDDSSDNSASSPETPAAASGEWTSFRGDSNMTGVIDGELPLPLKLAWVTETEDAILATAVVADSKVYVGSSNGEFYCLNLEDGAEIWRFKSDDCTSIEGSAALVGAGVYFGCGDGLVFALNRETGEELWRFECNDQVLGGVNYYTTKAGRELVVVGSYDYFIYSLDAKTGEKVWGSRNRQLHRRHPLD